MGSGGAYSERKAVELFTGIVAGQGLVTAVERLGAERRFAIRPLFAVGAIVDGESIAVNGACLSVETHKEDLFTAYASGETIDRTNLGLLQVGGKVNLEWALRVGDRLGGHMVSGHIDCLATVEKTGRAGESLALRLGFPEEYGGEVISKGSVALNGISLTVNDCGRNFLEVNVIPDSQKKTNLPEWRRGSLINMETDVIGKYVRHLLQPWRGGERQGSGIDAAFLASNGFM